MEMEDRKVHNEDMYVVETKFSCNYWRKIIRTGGGDILRRQQQFRLRHRKHPSPKQQHQQQHQQQQQQVDAAIQEEAIGTTTSSKTSSQMIPPSFTTSMSSSASSLLPGLVDDEENICSHIQQFIGPHQYRFIATINHQWYNIYTTTKLYHPNKNDGNNRTKDNKQQTTYCNVSTIHHTILCYQEMKHIHRNRTTNDFITIDIPSYLCAQAAKCGALYSLQYLHCIIGVQQWDVWTCINAAKYGHFHILQYAHINGCPWNGYTCLYAAEYGHLDILQYAITNGCRWNKQMCRTLAEQNNHVHILQYIMAQTK